MAYKQISPISVAEGGTGGATFTDHGVLVGSGTGAITALAVGTNGQVILGSTGADPVFATLTSSGSTIAFTPGAGTLNLETGSAVLTSVLADDTNSAVPASGVLTLAGTQGITTSAAGSTATVQIDNNTHTTAIHGWDGAIIETAAVTVTSDGVTITFSVEQSGGGDLTVVFSDGFYAWDTTPADTVTLTAGSDTSPQINYVYFDQGTKTLTNSTTSFPSSEHAPLATVLCQSAASLQTYGAYKVHAWTDHVEDSTNNGHIAHLNEWIRRQDATWVSGVAPTLTITPNGGSADNVVFTSTAGVVLQLHDHTFPAFAGTPDVYVVNNFATPYTRVTDLNTQLTDASNVSMSGRYFSLVIWGVVSQDTSDCKLMCNLPTGSYLTQADLIADPNQYAVYTIPSDFTGTGFLIAELQLRHQAAAGGTWTEIDTVDLRGQMPQRGAGGSTVQATEFADNVFRILDNSDPTKEIAFQASGITTATTRTLTVQDADGTIALSGVANYGTGATTFTDHGVLVGSGTSPITPLAVGTNGQLLVGSTGADPVFADLTSSGSTITVTGGAGTLNIDVTAPLTVANGGTGLTTITDHGILLGSGTGAITPLGAATNGQIPIGSTGADPVLAVPTNGTNITWTTGAGTLQADLTATVAVSLGGTGATTLTDHGVLVGSGTGAITPLAVGTTGQLLVGSTGADPAFASSASADFTFTTASSGTTRILAVTNTDTTGAADSSAELHLQSQSASAGDPYVRFDVASGQDYALGVDNSDSDALKITDSSDPSTGNTVWKMTSAGERTMPLQPAFLAFGSSNDLNVTGNGTEFTLGSGNALTEIFDQNSDFVTTGTFTAPVTGRYLLGITTLCIGNSTATQLRLRIVTSNRTYDLTNYRQSSGNPYGHHLSTLADMDASDTATFTITVSGEAGDTSDVQAVGTFCHGHLVC